MKAPALSASTPVPVLCVFSLLLAGCSNQTAPPKMKGAGKQAAVVTTAAVREEPVPVDIQVIGSVEPYTSIRVKAQVNGQLTKVYFKEGQDVKAGDLLFLIDPRPYDEAIRQAEANLARSTALLRQAEANLQRDIAQEKFARDQAARYQKLFAEGIGSRQEADQYNSDAEARAEAVRASQAAIESARAAVKADTATLENARLQRSYCEIRSPVDGRTGAVLIQEGNLVRTSDSELVSINQVQPIFVTFSVPETRLPEIRKYMASGTLRVLAAASAADPAPSVGELSFIDNTVDTTTGTIRLKAVFPNRDNRLWPGQFVNVTLRLTTLPNAVVAPVAAIQTGQEGQFAYVVDRGVARMRPVVTGLRAGERVVIERGLQAGEIVVTEGQLRLADGMPVRGRGEGKK
jgi:multidrug efflux system membrane fusion protein